MARFHIRPSHLKGQIHAPSSKSHSLRAILFAAMAQGTSRIRNLLPSPDAAAMVRAMQSFGAQIETLEKNSLLIRGTSGKVSTPDNVIDCGNSGQVLRFAGALSALQECYAILTGDDSIRHLRPVRPLLEALKHLGATALSARLDDYAPIVIRGPLFGKEASLPGEDSQPVSGLLIMSAFAPHPIHLKVINPGEKPWIGLTLYWFDKLSIPYKNNNFEEYEMQGGAQIEPFDLAIPGDFSSAAFPVAAALVTHSNLDIIGLDRCDPQGDKKLFDVLVQMNARLEWEGNILRVQPSELSGIEIDVNDFVDAVPILAVLACYAQGTTHIMNAAIARKKECDRLRCIAHELRKMGAKIEELEDGLMIEGAPLQGATHLETYHDHRMVMALSVAALGAFGESSVVGVECVSKSYPRFLDDFRSIGAQIELLI